MFGILKRKRKRLGLMTPATVTLPDLKDQPIKVQILNISHGGACLHVRQQLEGPVQIAIDLGHEKGQAPPEQVSGEVRWKKRLVGSSWLVGIAFKTLKPKEHPRLISYLDRNIKK